VDDPVDDPLTGTYVDGKVAEGFEPVADAFRENFTRRGEVGASCAVYLDGRAVVDLWGGRTDDAGTAYRPDTLQMVASATKGAMAICVLRLAEQGRLDLEAPVAEYWPEFGAAGKREVTVRDALAHRAGVPFLDGGLTLDDVEAWDPAAEALAAQRPAWEPGSRHGYHALTHAWLVGELIRRVTGRMPGAYFAAEVAAPLDLDLYVGLPVAEHGRVTPMRLPGPPEGSEPDAFTRRMLEPGTMAHRAFFVASGLFGWLNDPRLWSAELPAANGMGNARALARMYAACLGEVQGTRLLRSETVESVLVADSAGTDEVTGYETRYRLGFQLPFPFRPMSGEGAFGHYGLGGSVGFADVRRGFSFGYAVNQMGPATPADPRSTALVDALLGCLP
jgi:CubicO group peptidase (beta-lactamase class C family)